jgi:hypothetical protein
MGRRMAMRPKTGFRLKGIIRRRILKEVSIQAGPTWTPAWNIRDQMTFLIEDQIKHPIIDQVSDLIIWSRERRRRRP